MPRILVLRAAGINCDEETAAACELAGGSAERIHVNRIAENPERLLDYAALIVPGGFSYGDHLGAGKLLAVDLIHRIGAVLERFVEDGRPVLGICNGFQVLVKSGLLPGGRGAAEDKNNPAVRHQEVTLTDNVQGHYECRWVRMLPNPASPCIFTKGIEHPFTLPIGHGEGRFVADDTMLDAIDGTAQIVLRYGTADDEVATAYPDNPNGSARSIAGLCNPRGTVFGLMPHPDRAYLPQLHPDWLRDRTRTTGDGLPIFRNMVRYAQGL